jgi:hypothetical protein
VLPALTEIVLGVTAVTRTPAVCAEALRALLPAKARSSATPIRSAVVLRRALRSNDSLDGRRAMSTISSSSLRADLGLKP